MRNLGEVIRKRPIGVKHLDCLCLSAFISMTGISSINGGSDLQEVIISQV